LIAVIALPLKCTNDNGDYPLIGEFFDKERKVHYDCLKQSFPGICETLENRSDDTVTELHNTLKLLGETATKAQVRLFLKGTSETEIPGLITLWFTKRNVFGEKI
jgi:hypothetical protein